MPEVKRLETFTYDEEEHYFCECDGQTCEVFFGLSNTPDEWIEPLWALYNEGLHMEEAIQEQSCYTRESFRDALKDPDYNKIVLVIDGDAMGLMMGTNNLEKAKVAYINPDFIRKRFPTEVNEGRFWYATVISISPKAEDSGFKDLLLLASINEIVEKNQVLALDVSDTRLFLPKMFAQLTEDCGSQIEEQSLGSQTYYAFRKCSDEHLPPRPEESAFDIERLVISEYGEEKLYRCKHGGQTCKLYYRLERIPKKWIEPLWKSYEESLHIDEVIQEQSCYSEDVFRNSLIDPDYSKIVLVIDEVALGLIMLTNNLEKARVAYINPNFIKKRFPREVEKGLFWYMTCFFISKEVRNLGFARLFGIALSDAVREYNYTTGSDLSDSRLFLADLLVQLTRESGVSMKGEVLGSQSYFAYRKRSLSSHY